MVLFNKIEELKHISAEIREREFKMLDDYNVGLTTKEASKYLKKGEPQVLEMVKQGILEWRLIGEGDDKGQGRKLISIESLRRYKQILWSKEFDGDGFFSNIQKIYDKARVTRAEAERLGVVSKRRF